MINWTDNSPGASQIWQLNTTATWTATGTDIPDWIRDNKFNTKPWYIHDNNEIEIGGTVTWDGTNLHISIHIGIEISDWMIEVRHQSDPDKRLRWPGRGAVDTPWVDLGAQAHDREDGDITHKMIRTVRYRSVATAPWTDISNEPIDYNNFGLYDIQYNVQDAAGVDAVFKSRNVTYSESKLPPGTENNFKFEADYCLITYTFTDGRDLDTATLVTSPYTGSRLGWCASHSDRYATFGGDNTGTGQESVLIDIKNMRNAYPSGLFKVTLRCWWYGSRGSRPVVCACTFWKGGSPQKFGYSWINSSAQRSIVVESPGKVISTQTSSCASSPGVIAELLYDLNTYDGGFLK